MVDGEIREWTKSCNRYVTRSSMRSRVSSSMNSQELIGKCYEDLRRGDVLASEGLRIEAAVL